MKYIIRRADERGHADHGWLNTYHTFSFADYYDKDWMGFKTLRVINEDRIAPGQGFGTHGHQDMEIITYVLSGALRHTDSMGNSEILKAGEVQRMTAGTGVEHSEVNASETEECHLYQIWILPDRQHLRPSYEQKPFWGHLKQQGKVLVASPDAATKPGGGGRIGALKIHQNAEIWLQRLAKGESTTLETPDDKEAWVQVISGTLRIKTDVLEAGDAFALIGTAAIQAEADSEFMTFIL